MLSKRSFFYSKSDFELNFIQDKLIGNVLINDYKKTTYIDNYYTCHCKVYSNCLFEEFPEYMKYTTSYLFDYYIENFVFYIDNDDLIEQLIKHFNKNNFKEWKENV